ncbi:fatty acid desaturase [Vitiosangium sp. GDMCC 1.1324]|uniref:fatty acid desaturase family protein n=1 Tax=Vitiosangium sp. (strain GDMCC 1.1324) TaxID=2138576 RepID=UPI000D3D3774|nr:fatty acid desaturase [Vitiosangium sp. GDMCC 1.1324]PTL84521.1 dihydrorhizobitoxine desaturase [Vitiosangium sp. GDMCC 1.1324]
MLPLELVPSLTVALLCVDLLLRAVVYGYYRDPDRILRLVRLRPRKDGKHEDLYTPLDEWFAPFPFLWTWLDIYIAVLLAKMIDHPLAWGALTLWVGGRFRALQEFGHNAVHFALCRARGWQWWLSDIFYQFPAFKRDMHSRQITHTQQHHRNPNHEKLDPNRARVFDGGMHPGMTQAQFFWSMLYPLRFSGLMVNLKTMMRNSLLNHSFATALARALTLLGLTALLGWTAGWKAVAWGWLVPLMTSYSLFAWVSLLTEHRWFVSGWPENRLTREFLMCRPTDYPGFTGWLVRVFICPTSDAYHLAHSLYPGVRWNYLPAIDRVLKVDEPRYTEHASQGLLFFRDSIPSALSELRERLVTKTGFESSLYTQEEQ